MDLAAADRAHLWHPFTQQREWVDEEPLIVERAEGTDLIDIAGRRYIDGVSSLWCTVHGHGHPQIDAAVREQLDRVAHSTMLGLTHPAAIELARRLVDLAPPGLTRCFYSDSGASAAARTPRGARGSSPCATPTTATPWARSPREASTSSTPPTNHSCSTPS